MDHNRSLRSLGLYGNSIGGQGAERPAAALEHNSTLTSLSFNSNRVGDPDAELLADELEQQLRDKPLIRPQRHWH